MSEPHKEPAPPTLGALYGMAQTSPVPQSWHLELLGELGKPMFPRSSWIDWDPLGGPNRPLVLLGEEGAGLTSFHNWIRHRLGAPRRGRKIPRVVSYEFDAEGGVATIVTQLASALGVPGEADLVSVLRHALTEPKTTVCLLHIERIDRRAGGRLLGQLRGAFEAADPARSLSGLRLVVSGRDELALDNEPYSAITDVGDVCRLARLPPEALQTLLPETCAAVIPELHRVTGGQPLLTQRLRMAVSEQRHPPDPTRLYRALRDAPPKQVHAWQVRLARIIRDPQLRDLASDLVRGKEYPRDRAPGPTQVLSIAGWMSPGFRLDGTPVWRFSDLHRYWAEAVLRRPADFDEGVR